MAQWKRVDLLQDVLPEKDAARAGAAGSLAIEEWMAKVRSGAPDA